MAKNNNSSKLSFRSSLVKPFLAMEVLDKAKALKAQGRNIIELQLGEPDFDTPEVIKEAHTKALTDGFTHYLSSLGDGELQEALAEYYQKRYRLSIDPERFFITPGSSIGLMLICAALFNQGDGVIMSNPCYPCYANMACFFGADPQFVPVLEEEGFLFRSDDIRAAIEHNTKAIMINSPSNPTGTILGPERLKEIASMGPLIISDEIYHGLSYGEEPDHCILEYTDNAVVAGGFSKIFAMTGWRLGYLILPPDFIGCIRNMAQNFFISTSAAVQKAGVAALKYAWDNVEQMRQTYDRRRKIMFSGLNELGLKVKVEPTGAFYMLANAAHLSNDSLSLAFDILEKAGVGVTPGIDFGSGAEGFLRFCYANSEANIEEALARLEKYLAKRL